MAPKSDLLKSPQVWLSYMHESSVESETAFCFRLCLDQPLLHQPCNVHDVENLKLIGHPVSTAMLVSDSKFAGIVADASDPFLSKIFLAPLRCLDV